MLRNILLDNRRFFYVLLNNCSNRMKLIKETNPHISFSTSGKSASETYNFLKLEYDKLTNTAIAESVYGITRSKLYNFCDCYNINPTELAWGSYKDIQKNGKYYFYYILFDFEILNSFDKNEIVKKIKEKLDNFGIFTLLNELKNYKEISDILSDLNKISDNKFDLTSDNYIKEIYLDLLINSLHYIYLQIEDEFCEELYNFLYKRDDKYFSKFPSDFKKSFPKILLSILDKNIFENKFNINIKELIRQNHNILLNKNTMFCTERQLILQFIVNYDNNLLSIKK